MAENARVAEAKAREFSHQVTERFKLEQAARAFGRQATANLKRQMEAEQKVQCEAEQKLQREAKLELEKTRERQQDLSDRLRDRLPVSRTVFEPRRQRTFEPDPGPERDRGLERDYPDLSR